MCPSSYLINTKNRDKETDTATDPHRTHDAFRAVFFPVHTHANKQSEKKRKKRITVPHFLSRKSFAARKKVGGL